jgi:hypothetical protein
VGGDIGELMAVLDPDVVGEARLLGGGLLTRVEGRPDVARRILGFFGPESDTVLTPMTIEGDAAFVAITRGRIMAVVRLHEANGVVHHIHSFVQPPA